MNYIYKQSEINDSVEEFMKILNLNTQGLGTDVRVFLNKSNSIVACAFIQKGSEFSEIFVLGVDSNHRRKGVGKAFVEEIIRELKQIGNSEIGVEPMDLGSYKFWRSNGFEDVPGLIGNYKFPKLEYKIV